jgi:hypothetical protein
MRDALSQPTGGAAAANTTAVETEPKLVARPPTISSAVARVLQGAPFIALIGPDAATSSAAAAVVKSELEQASLRVLNVRRGDSDGLRLTGIAAQLLDKPEAAFDPDDIERLFEILTDPAGSGQPIVLVIDGAEALQQDVINYLRLLSTLASHAAPRIVFVGQPGLWQAVAALKDLIAAHWVLTPEDGAALRQPAEPPKTLDTLPTAAPPIRAPANDTAEPSGHPIPPLHRIPPVLPKPAAAADVKPSERPVAATDLKPPERQAATPELKAPGRSKADSALKVPAEPIAASRMKLPAQPVRETEPPGQPLPASAQGATLRVPAGPDSAPTRPVIEAISEPFAEEPVPAAVVRRRGPRYAAVLIGSAVIVYGAAEAAKRLDVFYGAAEAIKRLDVPATIHGLLATVAPSRPARVAVTPHSALAPAPQADVRLPVAPPAVEPEPATTPPIAEPKVAAPAPSLAPIARPKVTASAPSIAPAPSVAPTPSLTPIGQGKATASAPSLAPTPSLAPAPPRSPAPPPALTSAENRQPAPATRPTNLASAPIGAPLQIPVAAPATAPTAVRPPLGDLAPATTLPLPPPVSVPPPGLADAPAQAAQRAEAPAHIEAPSQGPVIATPHIAGPATPPGQSPEAVVVEPLAPLSRAPTFTLVLPPHAAATVHAAPPPTASPQAAIPEVVAPLVAIPEAVAPLVAIPQAATPPAPTAQVEAPQPARVPPPSPQAAIPQAAIPEAATPQAATPPTPTALVEAPQPARVPPPSPQAAIPQAAIPQAAIPEASAPQAAAQQHAAIPQVATPPTPTAQVEAPQPARLPPPSAQAASPEAAIPEAVTPPAVTPPAAAQQAEIRQATIQPANPLTKPPASVPPATEAAQPTATPVKLDPPDIRALITRGDSLLALGDIAAARLLYERAASLGSGRAATAVGRTYDPQELAKLRVSGPKPDKALAASWYRSGATLGDTEAAGMLRHLNEGEPAK